MNTNSPVPVGPIAEDGPRDGEAQTLGTLDPKTLAMTISNTVRMKNSAGGEGCYEGHDFDGKLTKQK